MRSIAPQDALIAPLTIATRNYAIVEHLCAQVGGVFFPLPSVSRLRWRLQEAMRH